MNDLVMGDIVVFDPTITTGNIVEIVVLAAGGLLGFGSFKSTVSSMRTDITDVKDEVKKVGEVLIAMARVDQRLINVEQDVREMKHGRGFVHDEIRGEWPR